MKKQRTVMLADCQSFFASVEKAAYPEYVDSPLVVAGDPARRSGIVLAACPIAKGYGISTAERLGEALGKCPQLVVVRPRMQHYIDTSLLITNIYEEFTDLVEVFSIDEQFLDMTDSMHLFGGDVDAIAKSIQHKVMQQTGVRVRIGISENKYLAKLACDIHAKKNEEGIFRLEKSELVKWIWPQPAEKMFGVGGRMKRHLQGLGLPTIGHIANTPLPRLKEMFRARFGRKSDIQAETLWRTANGMDDSPVSPYTHGTQKSIGHQMTLPRDYQTKDDINTVLLELCEEICRDCRRKGVMGSVVTVGCMCSPYNAPTGFSRQSKLAEPTNHTNTVYQAVKALFYRHWNGMPVRRLGVTLSDLSSDQEYQLTLFEDQTKLRALEKVTDQLKCLYGSTAIMRASSLTAAGQVKDRAKKIGGHLK